MSFYSEVELDIELLQKFSKMGIRIYSITDGVCESWYSILPSGRRSVMFASLIDLLNTMGRENDELL